MIGLADIERVVAFRRSITIEQLRSVRRSRIFAWPRQEAFWLARQLTTLSQPQIGTRFVRDHTTVLHGVRAVDARMAEHPYYEGEVLAMRGFLLRLKDRRAAIAAHIGPPTREDARLCGWLDVARTVPEPPPLQQQLEAARAAADFLLAIGKPFAGRRHPSITLPLETAYARYLGRRNQHEARLRLMRDSFLTPVQGRLLDPILVGGGSLYSFTPVSREQAVQKQVRSLWNLPPAVRLTLPPPALIAARAGEETAHVDEVPIALCARCDEPVPCHCPD